ncbi:hypothetical protein DM806_22020 [Sphingobium lactosutens]|uniref:hypothetical protein n=1 Tax=Sphingobium lactosutens TaxID=522773 RepID=UPI0015BE089B|nr:hypothetical protein [Sphingobium lactosutens]NWK98293.1 hypothetical protein [Sphingobium lactosutens]
MSGGTFESILIVYQNAVEGRQDSYDDWYTNIHIRDAMRLDGAIATQRFIITPQQPIVDGRTVDPGYFAHTIYEWESAAKSVLGHKERVGTASMEVIRDASFDGLRDYFYRPVFLSHGWTREKGFRRGEDVITALIRPKKGDEVGFSQWFEHHHAPDALKLPGVGSVGLFSYHEEQSLPTPFSFPLVAIYGIPDRSVAVQAWTGAALDLISRAEEVEAGCWQARIPRLRSEDVIDPTAEAAAEERRARQVYAGQFLSAEEIAGML